MLQSGVMVGGTAILSAMNGITPHMAGAIDIMVVEQPDGTLKSSPFYGAWPNRYVDSSPSCGKVGCFMS